MKEPVKNKGFTLIEMMIVVIIITVLVAVAIPALGNKKMRSAKTVVQVEPAVVTPTLTEECVNGFAFIRGEGTVIQKMGADGLPASCS